MIPSAPASVAFWMSPSLAVGPKHKDSRRAFYLSQNGVPADQALAACVPGFHMASLYEILDPSSLRYDTSLGLSFEDLNLDLGPVGKLI